MTRVFEITLEKPVYGGETLGRLPDGRAVFTPFGLPGEKARVQLTEDKKNFARGKLLEVVEPSPDRIIAKCKHFAVCGGCHYQSLPYEKQLAVKTEILRDQLRRIGGVENPPLEQITPSPLEWNYRNHIQFHLTEDGRLGFVNAGGDGVLPVEECLLPEAGIASFWRNLQFEPGAGVERVSLRIGADGELMVALESEAPQPPEIEIEAEVSAVHLFDNHPVVLAGEGHLFFNVLDREFRVSAASFFQVNTVMAAKMTQYLLALLPDSGFRLLDIYCGVGLFSKFFAERCEKVVGVELSESACDDFAFNLDEFDNVELYQGAAEDILPAFDRRVFSADCAIVDPPRAGIERRALDALMRLAPRRIVYVSCDPSTLARDAARIVKTGYRLERVVPFDFFPQTYHIETLAVFDAA
ncbi:MAG: class I SAM-dependent RNA methyltransferase [Chloroflexi bacterium]|nr:class I SAM-dependent RNA methyltransferase [Chloroflexota bacterium]MCA2002150.1 class I SAM-dependent RNA methyltransferase [Chloroflexota bacterium]